mmetsp:Transcript_38797/g.112076  ORF Transcript_38797/g.112076 Transcript_38797/m.112076 type:complete len:308 (-) Transcript_38797:580-1503(-)
MRHLLRHDLPQRPPQEGLEVRAHAAGRGWGGAGGSSLDQAAQLCLLAAVLKQPPPGKLVLQDVRAVQAVKAVGADDSFLAPPDGRAAGGIEESEALGVPRHAVGQAVELPVEAAVLPCDARVEVQVDHLHALVHGQLLVESGREHALRLALGGRAGEEADPEHVSILCFQQAPVLLESHGTQLRPTGDRDGREPGVLLPEEGRAAAHLHQRQPAGPRLPPRPRAVPAWRRGRGGAASHLNELLGLHPVAHLAAVVQAPGVVPGASATTTPSGYEQEHQGRHLSRLNEALHHGREPPRRHTLAEQGCH